MHLILSAMTVLVFAVLGFSSSQRFMQRQPGIIADVYYLHKGQYPQVDDEKKILTNPKFFLDYYFKHGVLRSEPAYFNFLFYPTQDYDRGFLDYQGYPITAKDGYMLREFFALRLRSVLKLGLLDQPGLYQFALLSDDGSRLVYSDNDGNERLLIDSDGAHKTRVECAANLLYFDNNTRLPIRLDYFQGPKLHLSLVLMWRRVERGQIFDPVCGFAPRQNSAFFGEDYQDFSRLLFGQMMARGWKVVPKESFDLP